MRSLSQARQNLSGMSATTEGYVYIDASWLYVQPVNALLEEHRYVICFCCLYHISFCCLIAL
ncbi:Uncharacterised protein [Segatella copri]|nr:Uncharacterised protein [Segatella copri]